MATRMLNAGPLHILYQDGFLRRISLGGHEILRMMYFALRDENWWTYPLQITEEEFSGDAHHFDIHYKGQSENDKQKVLDWKCHLRGDAHGTILFEITGTVLENILKNRAGFCILHPIRELAGQPCEILHANGSTTKTHFPKWVDPENPFKELCGMRWHGQSHRFELKLEGDLFETEDQRNWSDASFKTFCTPLALPFPAMVQKGQIIHQKITFTISPSHQETFEKGPQFPVISKNKLPQIGLSISTETEVLTDEAATLLRGLGLSHVRADIRCYEAGWKEKLLADGRYAKKLKLPLEACITFPEKFATEADELFTLLEAESIPLKQIMLLSEGKLVTSQELINFTPTIRSRFPQSKIGAGTDYNFTELNRNRFDSATLDFVGFAIQPQEHAFDDISIMENTEAHADVVLSAARLYPGKEIHISPLTLKKRYNPYATNPAFRILTAEQRSDPRQLEEFCAEFVEASLKQLTDAGATSVTLFQTTGAQGIMSVEGKPYPVYTAIRKLQERNSE
jgi:D-apionolactonase